MLERTLTARSKVFAPCGTAASRETETLDDIARRCRQPLRTANNETVIGGNLQQEALYLQWLIALLIVVPICPESPAAAQKLYPHGSLQCPFQLLPPQ